MSSESSKGIPVFVWVLLAVALAAFLCIGGLIGLGGLFWFLRSESRPAPPPPVIVTPDEPQRVPAPPPPVEPPVEK